MANSSEIVLAVSLMRYYHKALEKRQSFRYILSILMCVSGLNCVIGATSGAFVVTGKFPEADFLTTWTDWFVGDVTGNFIVVYTCYMTKGSWKQNEVRACADAVSAVRDYFSCPNIVQAIIIAISTGITIFAYCIEFSSPTIGIPFVLLTTPVIASMGLVCPPLVVGFVDTVLVVLITIATRSKLGPIYSVFSNLSQHDVFLSVHLTFLITYVLSAVLSVVRANNISREKSLEKSALDKVAFFSHVSHELRTPLSVVQGYTEAVLNHENISTSVREDLESVMEASTTMATTVNDLLNVFRAEGHALDIKRSVVNMKDFSSGILSLVAQLSERKEIVLGITVSTNVPANLFIDHRRVRQLMLNIIGNAIKYTPRGGRIEVHVDTIDYQGESRLRVTTKDSGVGIKEEDIPKLFGRFFRCEHTRQEQGTGLGLAVCQGIVRSMGGKIDVESVFGSGTTFIFEVPASQPDIENAVMENQVVSLTLSDNAEPLHILVVEDSLLNKKLLVRILERHGHVVESVMDGASAVSAICAGTYDVVLLDLGLPLKPGIEVIRETRWNEWERVRNVPIIVTSGNVEPVTRENCLKEGCSAFADKPFREKEIRDAVMRVTQKT